MDEAAFINAEIYQRTAQSPIMMLPNFIIEPAVDAINEEYLKGAHMRDLFREYMTGKKQRELAENNCMEIHGAIERITNEIFPYKRNDEAQNLFMIEHPDENVRKFLHHHFLGRWRDGCSYGGAYHLHGLLEWMIHLALLEDVAYYALIWSEKSENGFAYHLPIDFCCPLAPETISSRKKWWIVGKKIGYLQRFGLLGRLLQSHEGFKTRNRNYPLQSIFRVDLQQQSPVAISMKYQGKLKSYFRQMSLFTRQQTYPNDLDIRLELARLRKQDFERRSHELLQVRIERIFRMWPRNTDEKITEYYDAFIWLENRLFLNSLRKDLIDSLNDQVFSKIKIKKNGSFCSRTPHRLEIDAACLLSRPSIKLVGLRSDDEYRAIFQKRVDGKMSLEDFQKFQLDDM